MRRGQAAVEFVILTSLMFLLFGITIIGIQKALVETSIGAKQRTVAEIHAALVNELSLAERMPAGYERTFVLPAHINGIGYNLTLIEVAQPGRDELLIEVQGEASVYFLVQNVSGTFTPGLNSLRRAPGVIHINE
jgi:hypothetical protein